MAFRTTIPVRFGDVDHAGIVYYPRFYIYFHEAFEDFFNEAGHSYVKLLDVERIGFPTVHVNTDFKAPLRYGDSLDIELTVTKLGLRSATMRYNGYRHRDGQLCVVCEITMACVDMAAWKPRLIPPDLRLLFERFQVSPPHAAPHAAPSQAPPPHPPHAAPPHPPHTAPPHAAPPHTPPHAAPPHAAPQPHTEPPYSESGEREGTNYHPNVPDAPRSSRSHR